MYESIRKYIISIHKIVYFTIGGSPSFEMQCRFEVEITSSTSRTDYLPRRTKKLKRLSLSFKTKCGFEAIATYMLVFRLENPFYLIVI